MDSNAEFLRRSLSAIWHPCTQMKHHASDLPMIPIAHGKGAWLYDFDGKPYLDGISSWWVNLFGHANPRINAALKEQLEQLEHVMLAGFTHAPVIELSERLGRLTGGALGHAFYASDGASATEIALKMSFHYWQNTGKPGKTGFICLAGSYHGETVGALGVTDLALFKQTYAPLLHPATVLPSPDYRTAREGETAVEVAQRAAMALETYLEEHAHTTAAVIVEPLVQAAGGMAMYDAEYLRLAHALCQRHDVHLICDEIAVGCGRTGTFFAHEQAGIHPDFICLSKGISGGYLPLSIVLSSNAIYAAFYDDSTHRAFLHSHSYSGNPLACRAALATLDIFTNDNILSANRLRAMKMATALAPLSRHPKVRHLRQRGMIFAFDIEDTCDHFARKFYRAALARQALIRPLGHTVYLMPPYILDDAEIAHLAQATLGALEEALNT